MNSDNREELVDDACGAVTTEVEAADLAEDLGPDSTEDKTDESAPDVEVSQENLADAADAMGVGDEAQAPDAVDAESASAVVEESDPEADEEEAAEPIPELSEEEAGMLGKVLFALLFASPEPLTMGRLKALTESPTVHVRAGLEQLEEQLAASELPLILRSIAGGFRLFSAPEVADVVTRLSKVRKAEQISPAALETLAIVAYRQPTTKAEVEAIRGVQAGPMLRGLIDRGLVKVTGRADQPGSPLEYGTTSEFLNRFGLENLKALPRDNELSRK